MVWGLAIRIQGLGWFRVKGLSPDWLLDFQGLLIDSVWGPRREFWGLSLYWMVAYRVVVKIMIPFWVP